MNREQKLILRVSDEEKAIIQEKAELNKMSVSNYLRTLGLYSNKIQLDGKIKQVEE